MIDLNKILEENILPRLKEWFSGHTLELQGLYLNMKTDMLCRKIVIDGDILKSVTAPAESSDWRIISGIRPEDDLYSVLRNEIEFILSIKEVSKERLTPFIYLLIRDHLPAGTVATLVKDLAGHKQFEYSNDHLAAMAKDYAFRLLSGQNIMGVEKGFMNE